MTEGLSEGVSHPGVGSWLRLALAIALVSGSSSCAAGSGDAAAGAPQQNAGAAFGNPSVMNAGTAPASGGSAGSPINGAAGTGVLPSSDPGAGRSGSDGASVALDASVADAAQGVAALDASSPVADASATDASADAGVDAGQSAGCAGSAFALCEDFESGALDAALWKLMQSKGTATLDSSRGARGSKSSLHVHVDPGGDTMVGITESKTFPALKAGLFARAFIFIPGAMASSLFMGDRHSRLIYAQGATPYGEYALGIWNGGLIQNHYSDSDDSQDTKMLPPFDQWFCLEYELDSASGNVKAYLNDQEITALRHDGWPMSNIDTLMFGVDRYGSFPVAEDIWFDDLVVDSARIGCTR